MGKQFLPKTDFPFKGYDKKLAFFAKNGQLLFLLGTKGKKNLFRPWICVFFSFNFNFLIQMDQEAMNVLTVLIF
jgi:hypothetical protein